MSWKTKNVLLTLFLFCCKIITEFIGKVSTLYRYENSLKVCNEDGYPYSVEYIKESRYGHFHSSCDERGFSVVAAGSKHLFCTPDLKEFSFRSTVHIGESAVPFSRQTFGILVGYNKQNKCAHEVHFSYNNTNLNIYLLKIDGKNVSNVGEIEYKDVRMGGKDVKLVFSSSADGVKGSIGRYKFSFAGEIVSGRTGIHVSAVYGRITFSDVVITSKEKIDKIKVFATEFTLPCQNGGMIPYTLKLDVFSYGSVYEMAYSFEGGISTRTPTDLHADVWITQYDDITEPYIKLVSDEGIKKFSLYKGTARFADRNLAHDIRRIFENVLTVKDTPLSGSFYLSDFEKYKYAGFGYEYFNGWGYMPMSGTHEYIFDLDGKLLYGGEPLDGNTVFDFKSPDKRIVNKIPKTLHDYEKAVYHAENNHYFYTDEKASFELLMYTNENTDFTEVNVTLYDAFFKKLTDVGICDKESLCFDIPSYSLNKYSFVIDELPIGVYHIGAALSEGGKTIKEHYSAFEVLDESLDISPQGASGLPVMYVGDGAPALSETCVPDFYAEKSGFDWGHYCSVGLHVPITAQEKKVWELYKLYNRKVFTWNTKRTILNYDVSKLEDIITHSDFNNYFYPELENCPIYYRFDLYNHAGYCDFLKEKINEFLSLNPTFKKELAIEDATASFTFEEFLRMMRVCGGKWIEFAHEKIREVFARQTAELKEKNPEQRRCSYGPWPAYHSNLKGGYSIKWYGFDPEKLHETFDGFLQFEDYPYSSAYSSYSCAWTLMTTKLLDRKVKIYPELYFSFPDACPDPAVTEAYPPFGGSECPIHFPGTQICEYVYNTPFFRDGKFGYWTDYGFSIFSFIDKPKQRAKEILTLWGSILENKPARPKKTTVFLYDFNSTEDRYEYETSPDHFYNISEANESYVYGIMKSAGLTGGFTTKFDDFLKLSEADISCIVLPDMTYASEKVKEKVRELHSKGVTLIAVSKVTGLEDLFGVKEKARYAFVNSVYDGCEKEIVTPLNAEFFYSAGTGKTELYASDGIPVVICTENTILINACLAQLGIDMLAHIAYHGRPNISTLISKTLTKEIKRRVFSLAVSDEGTGSALLETENGETLLVLTDYSKYDQNDIDTPKRHHVMFNIDEFTDAFAVNGTDMTKLCKEGVMKGLSVMLKPHETVIIKLK